MFSWIAVSQCEAVFSFITSGWSGEGYSYFYRTFVFDLTIAFINSKLNRIRLGFWGMCGESHRISIVSRSYLDRTDSFVIRFVRKLLSYGFLEGVILIFVPPNVWSYYRRHDDIMVRHYYFRTFGCATDVMMTSSYVTITSQRLVVLPTS